MFEEVSLLTDGGRSRREKNEAWDRLEDWGYSVVPLLIRALDLTDDPAVRKSILTRLERRNCPGHRGGPGPR